MSFDKANIAGLTSPQQQSEMLCILAGRWPPLKPLPVFKYETSDYRATIDFDKLRGEWVCRKTSFPSNNVQELRGELREITLALPHGEAEMLMEGVAEQEHELEKDTARRLEAIHDWKENYENGARYFELRSYLSESQRTELDDSLRLSLTARQLQFSAKNVSHVFDALSTAGGRFATLIEFAKRTKARQEPVPQTQAEEILPEAEPAIDRGNPSPAISADESAGPRDADQPLVCDQQAAEPGTDSEEPPAVSIKNVFQEPYQPSLVERSADREPQQLERETPETLNADSSSPLEQGHLQEQCTSGFAGLAGQVRGPSPPDRTGGPYARFPVIEISVFQVAVFASLILCAVIAFTVGLTMGRGPLGTRLREIPKSILTPDGNSPARPDQAAEPASRISAPPAARSDNSASVNKSNDTTPLEKIPVTEWKPPATPELHSEPSGAPGRMERAWPPATSAPLHLPRSAGSLLVAVPSHAGRPFRVTFPEKAVAATSSFALTTQLSVFIPPELAPAAAPGPARLEAGQLVSFVWPRFPKLRSGLAQVIRVRAAIGPLGQVEAVKFLSGSISLLPATTRAIRQWRYTPTLLDNRPVTAQQDLTIEFRPQSYSAQAATRHAPRNY